MAHPELEQFIGRGQGKAWLIFTWKNVGGMVGLGYIAMNIGQIMGGTMVLVPLGVLLGFWATQPQGGMIRLRRWVQLVWFYVMSVIDLPTIDTATLYETEQGDGDGLTWEPLLRLYETYDGKGDAV